LDYDRELDCLCAADTPGIRPIHAVRPDGLEAWLATLPPSQAGFLRDSGFTAKSGQIALLWRIAGRPAARNRLAHRQRHPKCG
jgi:hypothetical protein